MKLKTEKAYWQSIEDVVLDLARCEASHVASMESIKTGYNLLRGIFIVKNYISVVSTAVPLSFPF